MVNPFVFVAQCQMAALEGWLRLANCAVNQFAQTMMLPQKLLDHPKHRHHNVAHRGADLNDHYGRRPHDVDVERV